MNNNTLELRASATSPGVRLALPVGTLTPTLPPITVTQGDVRDCARSKGLPYLPYPQMPPGQSEAMPRSAHASAVGTGRFAEDRERESSLGDQLIFGNRRCGR